MDFLRFLFKKMNTPLSFQDIKQELVSNRRAQIGIAILAVLLTLLAWPSSNQSQRAISGADSLSIVALQSLPDLSSLDHSADIPPIAKLLRDPFLFEGPRPPEQVKKIKPPPPPPPPTAEEIAQKQLEQDRQLEMSSAPNDYRFIGFLRTPKTGESAAFINAEEPINLKIGSIIRGRWKLIEIREDSARFQNLKYPDLYFSTPVSSIGD